MLERLLCLLRRRHEFRLRSEEGVTFLACDYCGYRSSGWALGSPPAPTRTPESLRLLLGDPGEITDEAVTIPSAAAGHLTRRSAWVRAQQDFRLLFDA